MKANNSIRSLGVKKVCKILLSFLIPIMFSSSANSQDIGQTATITPPEVGSLASEITSKNAKVGDYLDTARKDRQTFTALKRQRGTTVKVPLNVLKKFCSDKDGCSIRIGMHNWDSTGRVASREYLFFYNSVNRAWRISSDIAGRDDDGVTTHVIGVWSCYFTDGEYKNWVDLKDGKPGFGLLSWNQHDADCFMTVID